MEYFLYDVVIFVASLLASVLAQLAGGGAALIIIPTLIFLGVDPRVAIASTKMTAFGNLSSILQYISKKKVRWKYVPFLITGSLLAAVIGGTILLSIESGTAETIFGFLILFLLPIMLFSRGWGVKQTTTRWWKLFIGLVLYLLVSVIQAAFGAGAGVIQTFVIVTFFGYPLLNANATRHVATFVQNVTVLGMYAFGELIDYRIGFSILAGSLLGNYLGATVAIYKGSVFMRIFFVILVVVSAARLLL